MEETVPKVRGAANVEIVGLMVSLDRMEVGKGGVKCALEEVHDLYGFETNAIVTMEEVIEHLYNKEYKGRDHHQRRPQESNRCILRTVRRKIKESAVRRIFRRNEVERKNLQNNGENRRLQRCSRDRHSCYRSCRSGIGHHFRILSSMDSFGSSSFSVISRVWF